MNDKIRWPMAMLFLLGSAAWSLGAAAGVPTVDHDHLRLAQAAGDDDEKFFMMQGRDKAVTEKMNEDARRAGVQVEPVIDGQIYMLRNPGGNVTINVGEDGIFVIDDSFVDERFPELPNQMSDAIRSVSDAPIRFVMNTHWHWDHTGGNERMAEAGGVIIAHDDVIQWMTSWQISGLAGTPKAPQPPMGVPRLTFNDTATLRFNGQTIRAVSVGSAHTAGDIIIHFEELDLFVLGDIYLTRAFPYVDLNTGGDIDGLVTALDKVLPMLEPDTVVIPGHGDVSTGADVRAYRNMVATVRDRVRARFAAQDSLEAVLQQDLTADFDADWATAFIPGPMFVTNVYKSLEQQANQ